GGPGIVAEGALRDALSDPDARLLILVDAGEGPQWVDAAGRPTASPLLPKDQARVGAGPRPVHGAEADPPGRTVPSSASASDGSTPRGTNQAGGEGAPDRAGGAGGRIPRDPTPAAADAIEAPPSSRDAPDLRADDPTPDRSHDPGVADPTADPRIAPIDAEAAALLSGPRGQPLAAVVSRTRFVDARPLLEAVRPLIARAALETEARLQAERVTAERIRADNAAAEARRRIERDLHDGVQGRLVSLGLGLSLARDGLVDPVSRGVIDEAVGQLHDAVAELRELSSGDLSARLAGTGLAAAVGDLARRMPVPVTLDVAPLRIAPDVETVAYFVIAEALTNAVKHAAPTRIAVRVTAGDEVIVRIADDGSGGADLRAGSGLRGLQERVHAIGGHLIVSDTLPAGTLVEAVLPCAS
ncbi:MAG: ATP-binding protein, partial [Microbacterium sp.]